MSEFHPAWRAHGVRPAIEVAHDLERELIEVTMERNALRVEVERLNRQLREERATQAALVEAIRQASATLAQWPSLVPPAQN